MSLGSGRIVASGGLPGTKRLFLQKEFQKPGAMRTRKRPLPATGSPLGAEPLGDEERTNQPERALVGGAALDCQCGQLHSLLFITKDYTCRCALLPGRWEPLARTTGPKGRGQHRLVKEEREDHFMCWCDRYQVASLHSKLSSRGILLCKASPRQGE